jgi:hypothetical protein
MKTRHSALIVADRWAVRSLRRGDPAGFGGRLRTTEIGVVATMLFLCFRVSVADERNQSPEKAVPVCGLHLSAPARKDLAVAVEFVREVLPKEGVNTLILEFNYNFDFQSRPEFANPAALGKDEVQQIAKACREKRIELIPQINCLGHQSWAKRNGRFLEKHPEFDETPGKYPDNEGIYCRSYCPFHPEVHKVLFDLIDELVKACEAKAFHVGMDEVFVLADADCPRCKGKDPVELFAREVKNLHAHLKEIGCRMWVWGDRFIDGKSTKLGKWEASENGTQSAIDLVPKDIVICDWHYERAPERRSSSPTKVLTWSHVPGGKPTWLSPNWHISRPSERMAIQRWPIALSESCKPPGAGSHLLSKRTKPNLRERQSRRILRLNPPIVSSRSSGHSERDSR